MSHGPPLPVGMLGYGMPMNVGPDMSTLQMDAHPSGQMQLMDNSLFDPFGNTMSVSLAPNDPLPQSFAPAGPVQASSHAAMAGSSEQPPFSSTGAAGSMFGGTGTGTGPTNPQRDRISSGTSSNTSTVTDFTKRRNWPAKIIEELQDLMHILDANGRMRTVSPNVERLTGYKPAELRDVLMRDLLHPDDVGVFTSELNESIASGDPLRVFYRMRRKNGTYAVFEAVGHAHIAAAKFAPNPNNKTPFCQAVFIIARPYPTKKAALLDSFLEHKMENERLKRKLADLQREQDDVEEAERTWQQHQPQLQLQPQQQDTTPTGPFLPSIPFPGRERRTSIDISSPTSTTTAAAAAATDFTPHTGPADTIEMLTGLRYQDGERSRGITTGNPNPGLVTGDVGIAIPVDRIGGVRGDRGDRFGGGVGDMGLERERERERERAGERRGDARAGEKKKKVKVKGAEEYVCTDCGTLESPEWRKGPSGPKTLCNACGLRWAKKEKKEKKEKQRSAQEIGGEQHAQLSGESV